MQISIIEKSENTVKLSVDPALYNDFDSTENFDIEIQFNHDADIDCEHYDCDSPTAPYVHFTYWSPIQSVPAECLRHQPQALRDFIAAL